MRVMLGMLMLGMAGCASTPAEVVERGALYEARTTKTASDAAKCVHRNTDANLGGFTIEFLPAETDGTIPMRARTGPSGLMVVGRFEPAPGGSIIKLWMHPGQMVKDFVAGKMMDGC